VRTEENSCPRAPSAFFMRSVAWLMVRSDIIYLL
jgi:hypothetical protein